MTPSPTDLRRYRHVIWDWNGTLLNDADAARGVVNGMLARRGLPPMDRDHYRRIFDFPIEHYYRRAGFDLEREPFAGLAVEFHDGYSRCWRDCGLHDAATPTLERLLEAGLTLSLLSAAQQSILEEHVTFYGVDAHFGALVGVDDHLGGSKEGHGRRWMAASGLSPHETVLVGDTVHDWQVAQALGVDCVLVADGHQSPERLAATGAPVVGTLRDLFPAQGL